MKLFYEPAYVGAAHSFETTRKSGWIAASLAQSPIQGVEVVPPTSHAECEAAIEAMHEPIYVNAVRTGTPRRLAESQCFTWDPNFYKMVLASTTGVLDAARQALVDGVSGSLSSGLHHARYAHGAGACTFNGLAIAAKAMKTVDRNVLIVDLDAHCGGGTYSLVNGMYEVRQIDVHTVPEWDSYNPQPSARFSLDFVADASKYLDIVKARLDAVPDDIGLVLYNAGMDPFERCSDGALEGMSFDVIAAREALVFDWCQRRGFPVAFVMAGGYLSSNFTQDELVRLHRMTISEAARTVSRR